MTEPGCYYYFGVTGAGKTYLALEHFSAGISVDGAPSLILDAMPAENFLELPHARTPRACLDRLYGEGRHAVYTPRTLDEIAYLLRGVHSAGRTRVLWDECANHLVSAREKDALEVAAVLRGWRHAGLEHGRGRANTYHVTTQRPGDLPPVFYTTVPEVYCFRLESENDLATVAARFKFDPLKVGALPPRVHEVYRRDRFA